MNADPYSEEVRQLFASAPHARQLDDAVSARVDDQGVRVELFAKLADGKLEALSFLAYGCPHLIAAAEQFCAEYEGQAASGLLEFSSSGLMKTLAVPAEKTGRIRVLDDAVRSLGSAVRNSKDPR